MSNPFDLEAYITSCQLSPDEEVAFRQYYTSHGLEHARREVRFMREGIYADFRTGSQQIRKYRIPNGEDMIIEELQSALQEV